MFKNISKMNEQKLPENKISKMNVKAHGTHCTTEQQ